MKTPSEFTYKTIYYGMIGTALILIILTMFACSKDPLKPNQVEHNYFVTVTGDSVNVHIYVNRNGKPNQWTDGNYTEQIEAIKGDTIRVRTWSLNPHVITLYENEHLLLTQYESGNGHGVLIDYIIK